MGLQLSVVGRLGGGVGAVTIGRVDASGHATLLLAAPYARVPLAHDRHTGRPYKIHLVAWTNARMIEESRLQIVLRPYRTEGEWFRFCPETCAVLGLVAEGLPGGEILDRAIAWPVPEGTAAVAAEGTKTE